MGTSTNAILFYGFCWDEEDHSLWLQDEDADEAEEDEGVDGWETRYARAKGCTDLTDWKKVKKIADASSCVVDSHCSGECPMPYVAVQKSIVLSRRGHPSKITSLAIDPTWNQELADFCETLAIDTTGMKAGWWLVSDWGI